MRSAMPFVVGVNKKRCICTRRARIETSVETIRLLRPIGVIIGGMHRRYGDGANLWRPKLMSEKPQSGVKNQHDGKNKQPSLRKMSSPCHGMFEWLLTTELSDAGGPARPIC